MGSFLTNPDTLPYKSNNSPFADRHYKHIVTGDLGIIRNNSLRKIFIKRPKYRKVRPSFEEKTKIYILERLDSCILNLYYENGYDKSLFLEWTDNVKVKIDERMSRSADYLYTNKRKYM